MAVIFSLVVGLMQAMSFFAVVAYVYCKSPAYRPLRPGLRPRDRLFLYLFFSGLSIAGTYLGVPVRGALANSRALGPILAGLIGGPWLGLAVGLTGGLHRYLLGGFTAFSCGVSTTVEGLIGGLFHLWLVRRRERVDQPWAAATAAVVAESAQMVIILLLARPLSDAFDLVAVIAAPMILANSAGAALFISILRDRSNVVEQVGAASSARALHIAERALSLLGSRFGQEHASELARIIHEETGVGAVAITDTARLIGWAGLGADHHKPGMAIASEVTRRAIAESASHLVDGENEPYHCPVDEGCPLQSVLVVPLQVDGEVVGTIKLYEPAGKRFLAINQSLIEGLSALLAGQLLRARYQDQKSLLVVSELKLARAQVNPHFLFNALNTIMSTLEEDSRARELLAHLSSFFRKNLKRGTELSTIAEELEHVHGYLELQKARFADKLSVQLDVDPALLSVQVPTFTLQPLLENAIKHGLSDKLTPGLARVHVFRDGAQVRIDIEDDAGAFHEKKPNPDGLGLQIVERRVKALLGRGSGLSVECVPEELTRVSVFFPAPEAELRAAS
jgi:two-component system, LytTR family, sensor kinase